MKNYFLLPWLFNGDKSTISITFLEMHLESTYNVLTILSSYPAVFTLKVTPYYTFL